LLLRAEGALAVGAKKVPHKRTDEHCPWPRPHTAIKSQKPQAETSHLLCARRLAGSVDAPHAAAAALNAHHHTHTHTHTPPSMLPESSALRAAAELRPDESRPAEAAAESLLPGHVQSATADPAGGDAPHQAPAPAPSPPPPQQLRPVPPGAAPSAAQQSSPRRVKQPAPATITAGRVAAASKFKHRAKHARATLQQRSAAKPFELRLLRATSVERPSWAPGGTTGFAFCVVTRDGDELGRTEEVKVGRTVRWEHEHTCHLGWTAPGEESTVVIELFLKYGHEVVLLCEHTLEGSLHDAALRCASGSSLKASAVQSVWTTNTEAALEFAVVATDASVTVDGLAQDPSDVSLSDQAMKDLAECSVISDKGLRSVLNQLQRELQKCGAGRYVLEECTRIGSCGVQCRARKGRALVRVRAVWNPCGHDSYHPALSLHEAERLLAESNVMQELWTHHHSELVNYEMSSSDLESSGARNLSWVVFVPPSGQYVSQILENSSNSTMDPVKASGVALGVLRALQHLHDPDSGPPYVHQHVCPDNVMVPRDSMGKMSTLLDVITSVPEGTSTMVSNHGVDLRGDQLFFSPEQLKDETPTVASDVYSVGALLYKMLTGKEPYPDTRSAVAANGGEGPVPPLVTKTLTPKLKDVVMKALDPNPDERYQTAEEMYQALEDADRSLIGDEGYDVFISYRVKTDQDLAFKMHEAFSAMKIGPEDRFARVFLDAVCLQDGGDWEADFVDALSNSKVFVPILSSGALDPLKEAPEPQSCCAGRSHRNETQVDNVLLEYSLAQLLFAEQGLVILPVLRGRKDGESGMYGSFSRANKDEDFPDVVIPALTKRVQYHIKRTPTSLHNLYVMPKTVREIVKQMKSVQGVNLGVLQKGSARGIADDDLMPKIVEKTKEMTDKALKEGINNAAVDSSDRHINIPQWRKLSHTILSHTAMDVASFVATLIALFGRDFCIGFLGPSADAPMDLILYICLVVFALELLLNIGSNRRWYSAPFFWLDLLASGFLLWELLSIESGDSEAASNGVAARIGRIAARSGRLLMVERVIMRIMQWQGKQKADAEDGSDALVSRKLEAAVSQGVSYRVLVGSFAILISLMSVNYLYQTEENSDSESPPQLEVFAALGDETVQQRALDSVQETTPSLVALTITSTATGYTRTYLDDRDDLGDLRSTYSVQCCTS
jgi:serine/threonine protein kinase